MIWGWPFGPWKCRRSCMQIHLNLTLRLERPWISTATYTYSNNVQAIFHNWWHAELFSRPEGVEMQKEKELWKHIFLGFKMSIMSWYNWWSTSTSLFQLHQPTMVCDSNVSVLPLSYILCYYHFDVVNLYCFLKIMNNLFSKKNSLKALLLYQWLPQEQK